MFAIPERKTLKLTNAKGRKEIHGDDQRQAIDLQFKGNFTNEILSMFAPALVGAFFTREGPRASDDAQEEMELPVAELHALRFPKLTPKTFGWDIKLVGATLSIFYGAGKPMVLQLCNVNDFKFTPINGGAVEVAFHVACAADITEKILGKCSVMAGTEVEITLEPPVVEAQDAPGQQRIAGTEARTAAEAFMTGAGSDGDDQAQAGEQGSGVWPFPGEQQEAEQA